MTSSQISAIAAGVLVTINFVAMAGFGYMMFQSDDSSGDVSGINIHTGSGAKITVTQGTSNEGAAGPNSPGFTPAAPSLDIDITPIPLSAEQSIKEHEGYSDVPYDLYDMPHICWGHQIVNPVEPPLTKAQCQTLFDHDYHWAEQVAMDFVDPGTWEDLTPSAHNGLIELAYVLGRGGLNTFSKLRFALMTLDMEAAAAELQDSLLPDQLGQDRLDFLKARFVN